MAGTLATQKQLGSALLWTGGAATTNGDVCVQTNDVSRYNEHLVFSTAGVLQVFGSLDGTTYVGAPLSLVDMGGISANPVTVTVAGRLYKVLGCFAALQVQQSGATAVAGAQLRSYASRRFD